MRRLRIRDFSALAAGTIAGMWLRILLNETTAFWHVLPVTVAGIPTSLVLANLLGTSVLVILTLRWGRNTTSRATRLAWGTGFCGSLTSYSALVAAWAPTPFTVDHSADFTAVEIIAVVTLLGILGAYMRWKDSARFQEKLSIYGQETGGIKVLIAALTPDEGLEVTETRRLIAGLYGTACVNILASIIGAFMVIIGQFLPEMWAIFTVAFLGCYSTFSTAIVDAWLLWRRGCRLFAIMALFGTFILAMLLFSTVTFLGAWVA